MSSPGVHAEPLTSRPSPASSADELVATLPGIVWEADGTDYRMTYVSPAARELLGLDPDEWVRVPSFWEDHLHPDDREAAIASVERAIGRIGSTTVHYRFRAGDGRYHHVRDALRVVVHPDGHRRLVGCMLDVSDEAAREEERRMLATIVETAADAAWVNDLDARFLSWNDAAERLYGWTREEVLGRTAYTLLPPEEHEGVRSWIARVAAGETVGPVDARHRGRDGRHLTLSVIAVPVRDADGRVTGLATIARDVSEERRLAAEHRLLETQLLQAQKLEAVGRLAGGIAHDFNNLLTAISGYAAAVAEDLEGEALADQREILRAAGRATELTRRLLAYARPGPRDPRPVAVDEVLRDGARLLRRLVPERIELVFALDARAHVLADPVELDQAVMNLVVNAADAIPGSGRIVVSTTRLETPDRGEADEGPADEGPAAEASGEGGTWVAIAVADTGTGIPPAVEAQMFQPFFTTKGPGAGSGLGLATVDAIAGRLGGRVRVDSRPGEGTTIELRIPVAAAATDDDDPVARPILAGCERVLVVDDAPMVGALARRMLERAGYRVRVESSPDDALAHGVDGIDVIVTDVVMPGLSGPELVARLGTSVPVVFVSGYTDHHLPPDLPRGGRHAFVAKPFSADELLGAVRRVLDAAG